MAMERTVLLTVFRLLTVGLLSLLMGTTVMPPILILVWLVLSWPMVHQQLFKVVVKQLQLLTPTVTAAIV